MLVYESLLHYATIVLFQEISDCDSEGGAMFRSTAQDSLDFEPTLCWKSPRSEAQIDAVNPPELQDTPR
jgi:hypothetical protein